MNGTNLINALAPLPSPSFLSFARNAGGFTLNWSAVAGISYQMQYSSTLGTTNWTNFGSSIIASNSVVSASDSFTNSQRFYRVLVLP